MNFCIARIIGNELPPRDIPGDRIKVLNYILENEVKKEHLKNIWVLNRIFDSDFLNSVRSSLQGQDLFEIPFRVSGYKPLESFYDKLQYFTNINAARNLAIDKARDSGADFFFIFDGDCYFSQEQFSYVEKTLLCSNLNCAYGIPVIRTLGESLLGLGESMPVIGKNFFEYFDESIPFGYNEKVDFLRRNKIKDIPGANCLHKSFSQGDVERDFKLRGIERFNSINHFISRLDASLRVL